MRRTTIFVDEQLEHDLRALARRRRLPVAAVVREAMARYVASEKRKQGLAIGFLAAGRSGHRDTASRHEELLWKELDPHGEVTPPRPPARSARQARRPSKRPRQR